MNDAGYVSDLEAVAIAEAHGVAAAGAGRHGALTCRWPEDRRPEGLVVFCHGLGASGADYTELSRHWAAHGYLVLHPTFSDSIAAVARAEPALGLDPVGDLSGWTQWPGVRARMHEILHAPERWLERVETVRAVMAALPEIVAVTCGGPSRPLPAAIAGHSFGAYTAQLLAGAAIDLPDGRAGPLFADQRFAAALLLSAQGREQQGLRDGSWDAMAGPVMTVTGTLDRGAMGGEWRWKSEPFELAPPGGKYLAVLDDADHYLGGFASGVAGQDVPAQRAAVRQLALAFLDAYLRDRQAARDWLGAIDDQVCGCPLLFRRS